MGSVRAAVVLASTVILGCDVTYVFCLHLRQTVY